MEWKRIISASKDVLSHCPMLRKSSKNMERRAPSPVRIRRSCSGVGPTKLTIDFSFGRVAYRILSCAEASFGDRGPALILWKVQSVSQGCVLFPHRQRCLAKTFPVLDHYSTWPEQFRRRARGRLLTSVAYA